MNESLLFPASQSQRERVIRGEVHRHGKTNQFRFGGCVPSTLPTWWTCPCIKHTAGDLLYHTPPHFCFSTHWPSSLEKMPLQSTLSGKGSSGSFQAENTQSGGKSFEELRQECLRKGVLFEDPDFPATDSSLFFSQKVPVEIKWKRPKVCRLMTF